MVKRKYLCRVCTSSRLKKIWDFGMTPLANEYLSVGDLDSPEQFYPLQVNQCQHCGNVQLAHVVDPVTLFKDYLYASSTSPVFVKHFVDFASGYVDKYSPNRVLDIGSNDGILLKPFKDLGVRVMGVEPAENIESSVPTIHEFFTKKTAEMLLFDPGKFDLITATNVFAHIDDLDEIVEGVKMLLADDGQFVVEVADLDQMLKDGTFDLIYHEHLNYWSEATLRKFFELRGMEVSEIERVPVHGGSLRVYVKRVLFLWRD